MSILAHTDYRSLSAIRVVSWRKMRPLDEINKAGAICPLLRQMMHLVVRFVCNEDDDRRTENHVTTDDL